MFAEVLGGWGLPEGFLTTQWRRSPATGRLSGQPAGVPTADQVRELLASGLRADRVSVSTAGRMHHPAEFTVERVIAGRTVPDVVDPDRLAAMLEQGATAILADGEHWMPWAGRLAAGIVEETGCEVQAHVFLTGGKHAGLVPHVDGEDNFLIQIEGGKSWSLWPPEGQASPRHVDPGRLGPPAMTVDLNPGDSLYIPLGWVHSAVAGDEGSTHITYQIVPAALLDTIVDQLAGELAPLLDEEFAAIGDDEPLAPALAAEIAATIAQHLSSRPVSGTV
ncbi:cupin domain-containing protein [Micromonospora arborensis]|uniref:JmjC domain-containing protein n=1 Tax=Micromonospora arborensis TaxID=2116518 RepID=UPI0034154B55